MSAVTYSTLGYLVVLGRIVGKRSFLTVKTVPKDCQVLYIGKKTIFADQKLLQGSEDLLLHVKDPATPLADEVMVVSFFGVMVTKPVSTKVGFSHQIQLLKQLQSAIHGGLVDPGTFSPNAVIDFLRCDMPIGIVECLKH